MIGLVENISKHAPEKVEPRSKRLTPWLSHIRGTLDGQQSARSPVSTTTTINSSTPDSDSSTSFCSLQTQIFALNRVE